MNIEYRTENDKQEFHFAKFVSKILKEEETREISCMNKFSIKHNYAQVLHFCCSLEVLYPMRIIVVVVI